MGAWEQAVKVFSLQALMKSQSVNCGGARSLPQGLVLTNKQMGQDLLPIVQMGKLRPERDMIQTVI